MDRDGSTNAAASPQPCAAGHQEITASIAEAEAREIVTSGMKDAGYQYVNLDGGWDLLQRGPHGELQPDPSKFPDGIKPGVDYVKFDWCVVPYDDYPDMTRKQVDQMLAARMRDALAGTGRPIVYSMSGGRGSKLWSESQDYKWASNYANLWRSAGDIADRYTSMVNDFTLNVPHFPYAGPGHWNDPDMLEVGNGGMTTAEDQSHFSLWAEMAAPLIAGNDLTTMSPATRAILTNRDVIAVDQDPLGKQGHAVAGSEGHWVLTKPLAKGDRAVVLFNQSDSPAVITTTPQQYESPGASEYQVRDLWSHTVATTDGTISATVAPHSVLMYRVTPVQ